MTFKDLLEQRHELYLAVRTWKHIYEQRQRQPTAELWASTLRATEQESDRKLLQCVHGGPTPIFRRWYLGNYARRLEVLRTKLAIANVNLVTKNTLDMASNNKNTAASKATKVRSNPRRKAKKVGVTQPLEAFVAFLSRRELPITFYDGMDLEPVSKLLAEFCRVNDLENENTPLPATFIYPEHLEYLTNVKPSSSQNVERGMTNDELQEKIFSLHTLLPIRTRISFTGALVQSVQKEAHNRHTDLFNSKVSIERQVEDAQQDLTDAEDLSNGKFRG